MDHNFNINIAQRFGVEEAILIHNIYFWVKKNAANEKHELDGRYWTYNSVKSFTILFPYWTHRQLERIINNSVEKGALLKGSQNKKNYDRTSWYTVTDLTISIYAKGDIHFPKPCNGFPQTVKPIPDSNTDNKNNGVLNPHQEYVGLKFVSIKDFKKFVSDFSLNKEYMIVAIKFWRLWMLENPNHSTILKAEVLKWYDVIRKIIEIDKQKIERLLAIYEYFYRCHLGESGYRNFWFRTIKSVGGLRDTNENGEYRLDKIIDDVNDKIARDSDFGRLVQNKIKQFKEHESIKLS